MSARFWNTHLGVPERSSKTKRPHDLNEMAASIIDAATDNEPVSEGTMEPEKNPHVPAARSVVRREH